jgi:pimaricinolide synthase PimS1
MTGALAGGELARMARWGMPELSAVQGLALLDAAVGCGRAVVVAARLDLGVWRGREDVPVLLRGLVRGRARPAAAAGVGGGLAGRLSGLSGEERRELLLETVRAEVAHVLGHDGAATLSLGKAFRDLGFDSLTAIEIRNRLGAVTGVRLPATLLFDYPTPAELVDHLHAELLPSGPDQPAALLAQLDRLDALLAGLPGLTDAGPGDGLHDQVAGRLGALTAKWSARRPGGPSVDIGAASDEEVFGILDRELGLS